MRQSFRSWSPADAVARLVAAGLLCAPALVAPGCGPRRASENPADLTALIFPYQWKGEVDKSGFREPSGVVYHRQRRTLFIAGDEGALMEMTTEGQVVQSKTIAEGSDFEGVTYDPATGLLYMAIEGEETIVEVDPDTFAIRRRWPIERTFNGRMVMKAGGQGIEAMTFVPDPSHPHGGRFFVANQAFRVDEPDDGSALIEVALPLRDAEAPQAVPIIAYHRLPIIDIAGLQYDAVTGDLFACSDSDNVIMRMTFEGRIKQLWAFPGDNQEGIGWDDDGYMYIAQDSGGVLKIRWFRDAAGAGP